MLNMNKKNQKGLSLYLTIIILSVLTTAILALVSISVSQIKIILTLGDSVTAFYAADTGIEEVLVERASPDPISGYLDLNDNGGPDDNQDSFYDVTVKIKTDPGCSAANYCIKSIGRYKNTKRAIEINY